jgi:hypothetical protein
MPSGYTRRCGKSKMIDKKLTFNGQEYNLVNTYDNKPDADRDVEEFNHTRRWHAVVKQVGLKYELYARKLA